MEGIFVDIIISQGTSWIVRMGAKETDRADLSGRGRRESEKAGKGHQIMHAQGCPCFLSWVYRRPRCGSRSLVGCGLLRSYSGVYLGSIEPLIRESAAEVEAG